MPSLCDNLHLTDAGTQQVSALRGIVLQSLKTSGDKFPARSRNKPRSLIDVASGSLPKSPVSLSPGDEVPHMFTRKPRLQLEKFAINGAKRLLQHNLPETDMHFASLGRAFQADGRGFSPIEGGLEGCGSAS